MARSSLAGRSGASMWPWLAWAVLLVVTEGRLADLAPGIRQLGEPRRLRHGWINGVKELPVAYR